MSCNSNGNGSHSPTIMIFLYAYSKADWCTIWFLNLAHFSEAKTQPSHVPI
ncbi:hypothetical protein SERLA73DRAFT_166708 [Serpula lacrymans var. lacrymans S7.3]|uniref:Uncharacterized protein n=2 Tax=Serpula lacrymans var. lacrymans TaxID=341189 RepID=F8PQI1_SERL3|nr:uncharacterized protein SERLADRAFT_447181 [Serpula lacrymans var. lacrymans S7.9]EGO02229.1 hypothetical protein SERLA73DRAFT_166708 [Serpula lacrymans var. lacrymans S7.3]EGO27946.1 hypothetical protein SERLADRAFT_447181 [Serpula lacrymans var. lacrymans S7.9]